MKTKDIPSNKFKNKDFVIYHSPQGSNYSCYCEVTGYLNNQKVIVKPLLKHNGSSCLDDISVTEEGLKTVPEYSLTKVTNQLQHKIEELQEQLDNLKFLQNNLR